CRRVLFRSGHQEVRLPDRVEQNSRAVTEECDPVDVALAAIVDSSDVAVLDGDVVSDRIDPGVAGAAHVEVLHDHVVRAYVDLLDGVTLPVVDAVALANLEGLV